MRWVYRLGPLIALSLMLAGLGARPAAAGTYSGLVVDADTGRVLYERNADEPRHPASVTKMMTLYLVFEALARGDIGLDSRFRASRYAVSRPPSKLGLSATDTIAVEDAILALVTQSANDVATLIGENLGGSEPEFALMMTQKARELGMRRTVFRNASGLPHPDQWTTARDMYRLGKALIQNFPEYYRYFSTQKFYYRGHGYGNHNHLMETYPGMDGIKTGFINSSGFNLVASAKRNGHRLIGVVFGGPSAIRRDAHMRDVLDDGFAQLEGEPSRVFSAEFDHPEPPGIGHSRLSEAKPFDYVDDELPPPPSREVATVYGESSTRASRLPPPSRTGRIYGESMTEFSEPGTVPSRSSRQNRAARGEASAELGWATRSGETEKRPSAEFEEPETLAEAPESPRRPAKRQPPDTAGETTNADSAYSPTRPIYRRPPDGAVVFDGPNEAGAEKPEAIAAYEDLERPLRSERVVAERSNDFREPSPSAASDSAVGTKEISDTGQRDFVEPETFSETDDDDAVEPDPETTLRTGVIRRHSRKTEKLVADLPVSTPKTRAELYAKATVSRRPVKSEPMSHPTPSRPFVGKPAREYSAKPDTAKRVHLEQSHRTGGGHSEATGHSQGHSAKPPARPASEKRSAEKTAHSAPARSPTGFKKPDPMPKKSPNCPAAKQKNGKCPASH